jgi:DNA mismatch repair protein MutL
MPRIKVLPDSVAQKIAAGEVVERPVSVVKELVENALDAQATEIRVELQEGGKKLIRVQDNGSGMSQEDAVLSFHRHATSKISSEEDLERISTLGFRGEALASISAVSRVVLKTCDGQTERGYQVEREGEKLIRFSEIAFPRGTLVEVRDLFFNLPARKKFLRAERSELSLIVSYLTQVALAYPEVKFYLANNNREIINCPAVLSLRDRVYQLFGKKMTEGLMEVDFEDGAYRIYGLSSRPFAGRLDRQHQFFFVNRRPIKDRMLAAALAQAYRGILEKDRNPEAFIFLQVPYDQVDVNVHPAKAEVRFREPQIVYQIILRGVEIAARQESLIKPIMLGEEEEKESTEQTASEGAGDTGVESGALAFSFSDLKESESGKIREDVSGESFKTRAEFEIIGQYLNAYLVVTREDGLYIIDQHNAHERVLFEKFSELARSGQRAAKQMLFPAVINLSASQRLNYEELREELESFGFRLEEMGGNSLALKEYPAVFKEEEAEQILLSVLEEEKGEKFKDRRLRMLATMACKAAVKAGQRLSVSEMEFLVRELFQTTNPGLCPHGRPVVIKIDRSKIEKTLGRQPE